MAKKPSTFYKYREFDTKTLESLCHDKMYFSHPGHFNDPMDCSPILEGDSSLDELRSILEFLIKRRVIEEVKKSLKAAKIKGEKADEHALKRAHREAHDKIADIAYSATDPDYNVDVEVAEEWLLRSAIEKELGRFYERGVCCFSTTYRNPLLWSHYGKQHQGLCIGYSIDRKPMPDMKRVVYGGGRTINTSVLFEAFIKGNEDERNRLDRDVLLRKARGWAYESEWRLIGSQGLQESPLLLCDVTFGLRCPDSVKYAVMKALDGRSSPVKLYEIYEVRGSYTLRRSPLDFQHMSYFPNTARSGIEVFGAGE